MNLNIQLQPIQIDKNKQLFLFFLGWIGLLGFAILISTLFGIFSIDKRDIIQHPKTRYQHLIQSVNKHSNPEAGHYIERSWGALFYPLKYTVKFIY